MTIKDRITEVLKKEHEGMTSKQIAKRTGIPVKSVRNAITRNLKRDAGFSSSGLFQKAQRGLFEVIGVKYDAEDNGRWAIYRMSRVIKKEPETPIQQKKPIKNAFGKIIG